jgi:hypothetical protein
MPGFQAIYVFTVNSLTIRDLGMKSDPVMERNLSSNITENK